MDSDSNSADRIEEAASRWFARRQSETFGAREQAQFQAWLDAATAHRIAYIRLEAAWNHAARMQALGAGVPAGTIPPRGSWGDRVFFKQAKPSPEPPLAPGPEPERRRRHTWRFAVAASAVLGLLAGVYVYMSGVLPDLSRDRYSTKVGAIDTVPLADGSQVTLNTDTHIRVALAPAERHVELDQGEAFFDVAKDPTRPFIVDVGSKRVVAVGTKFSVRREGDEIRVAVTEGKVRVERCLACVVALSRGTNATTQARHREDGSADVFVAAGGVAQTAHTDVLVHEGAAPEVEQLLSWRTGYLYFNDMTLADAVAEFNRYNTRKIYIEDPSIAAIRIGGNFRSNNTEGFLALLQSGFPIAVDETSDKVVLKGR